MRKLGTSFIAMCVLVLAAVLIMGSCFAKTAFEKEGAICQTKELDNVDLTGTLVKHGLPDTDLLKGKGRFETLSMWQGSNANISLVEKNAYEGKACLKLTPLSEDKSQLASLKEQFLPVFCYPGRDYIMSVWVRTEGDAKAQLTIKLFDGEKKEQKKMLQSMRVDGSQWQQLKLEFRPPAEGCWVKPLLRIQGKGAVYWDLMDIRFNRVKPVFRIQMVQGELRIETDFDESILVGASSRKLTAHITLYDPLGQKDILCHEFALTGPDSLKLNAILDTREFSLAIYRLAIEIRSGGKKLYRTKKAFIPGIDDAYSEMTQYYKEVNGEVDVNIVEAEKANPNQQETASGIMLFTRCEPRWIQPDSLPLPKERIISLERVAAPGDTVFFTMAALPLCDMKNVTLELEAGDSGKSLSSMPDIELGCLRYWPQRTHFSDRDGVPPAYWIVPELIEPMKEHKLNAGLVKQYTLSLKMPLDANDTYVGRWVIKAAGKTVSGFDVSVKVLPVELSQPKDVVFGLYIDPIRWFRQSQWYTDERILAELKEVREHGFNSLHLVAATPIVQPSYSNGEYTLDMTRFARTLRLYIEAGFTSHPYIINPYKMEQTLTAASGLEEPTGRSYTPEYGRLVDQVFKQIRETAVKPSWPEPLIHGVDEAKRGEKLDRAIRVLGAAKKHGFKTCSTTYAGALAAGLDEVMDYRNYCAIGFWDIKSEEEARQRRKSSAESGDVFWHYASGCYANYSPQGPHTRNTRQEGCLSENRYMHGLFLYRTGAKAQWAWTFCRWNEDSENDFDASEPGKERKEACTVYPDTADGCGIRPTLQWEALRQGWQDYRAVSTLDRLIEKRSDNEAGDIRVELNRRIAEIPWRNYTQYPNFRFEELREWILLQILSLTQSDSTGITETKKTAKPMSYNVKRVLETIDVNNQWNQGQWKQAGVLELTNYMGDKPEHFPKTQAKLLYDDDNLYVFFRVEDQYVRAVAEKIHGEVWKDSCVEFFFTPDAELEDVYFNLETNCGGTMLFRYNDKKKNTIEYIKLSDCEKVKLSHSLPKIIEDEITEPIVWTLSYKLPFDVIAQYGKITKPQPGVIWKANFYKCASGTSHPHYLTWSVVENPTPNFHLPQYFGSLKFE
ncbi:MAG: carbohydrate-binding family 9-like protein [Anaerohalosphaeraceae bacterium]|nr:carbohydrate-binding family 9-like protein [Anaerohalosphaeraceae bacterium]